MGRELVEYFGCLLVTPDQRYGYFANATYLRRGVALNFSPTPEQAELIESFLQDGKVRTLFSVEEARSSAVYAKLMKQIASYAASYFLDQPELLVTVDERPMTVVAITGITRSELQAKVDAILYANRPARDTDVLAKIIRDHDLSYRINDVRNNELRIRLFDAQADKFALGDDAVRYIVFKCTDDAMLIKSPEVIDKISANFAKIDDEFLEDHLLVLSKVFNRHKRILMALKAPSKSTRRRAIINKISRLSKIEHVPLGSRPASQTFVADVFRDILGYPNHLISEFGMRDLFKILNLLSYKREQFDADIFVIRNGKTWVEPVRPIYGIGDIDAVEAMVLGAISDVFGAKGSILIPRWIDYGLPISRKQALGNLPFGTKINAGGDGISSGIYWRNEWGARDLDLSSIDERGDRVGWGRLEGYASEDNIWFSGDIVDAPNGAMEFISSSDKSYGLYINIYRGEIGAEAELVVGSMSQAKAMWLESALVRERFTMASRGVIVGLVQQNQFTVFQGRLNNRIANFTSSGAVFQKIHQYKWTVKRLLRELNVGFDEDARTIYYDHDLSYASLSFDRLESLFGL